MKTQKIVTKDSLLQLLETRPKEIVIGRALVAIFNYQTESEKAHNATEVWNGVGFTGADGRSGAITAKYFLKHRTLTDWQVERWMRPNKKGEPRILKYANQLNHVANLKAVKNGSI